MKKLVYIFLLLFLNVVQGFAQSTMRGKVSDENGETLIGVTLTIKSNRSIGCVTDFDGNYSLQIPDTSSQTVVVSFISYKTIEFTIHPKKGEVVLKDFVLKTASQDIKEVEIVAKSTKSRDYYMENMKKKSATTIDYVSSESMKKTGDANVTAAVTRVSGISTNGSFITVRGIGDRYVKTCINGSRIPTLDPFTNNIKLDLFPASLIDNVIITKTASPDLPGDWSGAYLSIETKDYPEKLAVAIETTLGYNAQTTGKDVISSQRSETDWLGYDNSYRENSTPIISANVEPDQYTELVALGLGDYYKSLGVNGWVDNDPAGDAYFKLGLVQLGLLAPALINDPVAFNQAKQDYSNGTYKSDAFKVINADVPASSKAYPNNWNTTTRKAPLNFSQSFSIGNQTTILGRQLGVIAGFRYGNSTQYDPSAKANRASVQFDNSIGAYIPTIAKAEKRDASKETNGWSALLNMAYKLNSNNSISVLFMPNFTGVNNVYLGDEFSDSEKRTFTKSQLYEQRKQLVYQLRTEHYIPSQKIKIDFSTSYTNGRSSTPDFKNLQYQMDTSGGQVNYLIGNGIGDEIKRFFRNLDENILDSRISLEIPIGANINLLRKIKVGGSYQRNDQKYKQSVYKVITSNTILQDGDIDKFLDHSNFEISNYVDINGIERSKIDLFYSDFSGPANRTFGESSILSGFVMTDYTLVSRLRFSGGVRIEQAKLYTDIFLFDSLGLAKDDKRRFYDSSQPLANPGQLSEVSILPSANLIFKIKEIENEQMNLRAGFSQTVARPSLRELSDVSVFDYELRAPVFGNSELKMVRIDNYDLRFENYFKNNDNVSISVFYKNFKNHIELVNSNGYTWINVDKSNVMGVELEGRKSITNHLEFRANLTLVKSQTEFVRNRIEFSDGPKVYIPEDTVKRSMFGQAPYIINTIVSYNSDSLGLIATLSYNRQGRRVVIASANPSIPDVYELPRNMFDFKISKTLGSHFTIHFTMKDILNTPIRRAYVYDNGDLVDYDNYRYRTNYILGLIYKL